ncbi:MAG: uroporphyrinogen decarboxylase family protein [Eubacteriaceae bacterium]
MNSLERVSLALQHKEADHVPVYPLINSVSRKTLGISYEEWTKDVDKCAEAIIKATDEIDVDCICTLVDLSVEAADWGAKLVYFEDQAACPEHDNRVLQSEEDYSKISILNPRETPRMSEHIELAKKLYDARGQVKPIVGFVFGPLGILGMLRGHDYLFMDLMMYPDKVHAALRNITETLKEFIRGLCEVGCHAIMLDTLFASQSIMSKEMWDEFEGGYSQELAEVIRECGAMVMIHNCGNGIYFEEQIKRMDPVLISYMHIPSDCTDMADIKAKYGDKITLMGHIEPGWLMVCTEEELRNACKEQIDVYKKDGGFVLATGCEYPASMNFDYAKVMVDVAKTYGKY